MSGDGGDVNFKEVDVVDLAFGERGGTGGGAFEVNNTGGETSSSLSLSSGPLSSESVILIITEALLPFTRGITAGAEEGNSPDSSTISDFSSLKGDEELGLEE